MTSFEQHSINFRRFWELVCLDGYQRLLSEARRLGRELEADDLVQETVCRALARCKDPSHVEKPVSYLLGMMHNIWRDKWRKERRFESLDDIVDTDLLPKVESEILNLLEQEQSAQNLWKEYNAKRGRLTDREKHLLSMHLSGYKNDQIAEKLGEDVRVTRSDLNATISKVRYRMKSKKVKRKKS